MVSEEGFLSRAYQFFTKGSKTVESEEGSRFERVWGEKSIFEREEEIDRE